MTLKTSHLKDHDGGKNKERKEEERTKKRKEEERRNQAESINSLIILNVLEETDSEARIFAVKDAGKGHQRTVAQNGALR